MRSGKIAPDNTSISNDAQNKKFDQCNPPHVVTATSSGI